jgi:hypothetical protein
MLAWSRKVSKEFADYVESIAMDIGFPADYLMAIIAFESGKSFSSEVVNLAGSGATGLIQFMPSTAISLGTTVEALSKMSPEYQLYYVHKYFKPYKGRLNTLEDVYMVVLWPRAVGKPNDYVLFDLSTMPTTYRQNAGLDWDKDGKITKSEACKRVRALLEEGLKPENVQED